MKKNKRIASAVIGSVFTMALGFGFLSNVSAFQGSWTSDMRYDGNGISEVGTTYAYGAGTSTTVTLQNYYENGKMFGGENSGMYHRSNGITQSVGF